MRKQLAEIRIKLLIYQVVRKYLAIVVEELDALGAPKGGRKMTEAIIIGIEGGVRRVKEKDPYYNTSLDCRNVG
ncbi:MAG: hypothetical protein WA862_09315 [Solirubrobacterales bacterium]